MASFAPLPMDSLQGRIVPKVLIAFAGLLMACALGLAQEPQSDLNAPGPEHKKLDGLADQWDVTVRFPTGPGRTGEGQATCEAKWTLDGRFLRLEYSSVFAGKPLTVVRYLGFDRHQGKFVEVQLESTRTDVLHALGALSADGKTITTWGTHRDAATGEELKVRSVMTFVDSDHFVLEMFYGDGEKAKTITLKHQRRKPRAPSKR
jgi:hypothetical protein